MTSKKILQHLDTLNLSYEIIPHPPIHSADEPDTICEAHNLPRQKSLVLRNKKKTKFWMFTVLGGQKTDLKAIGDLVGDRVSFAKPEQLHELLNVTPGSCSPFGLLYDTDHQVEFWLQKELLESEFQGFHPNDNTMTVKMKTEDFQKFIVSTNREVKIVEFPLNT